MIKPIIIALFSFWSLVSFLWLPVAIAQTEETLETTVVTIAKDQSLKLKVTKGSLQGKDIVVESGSMPSAKPQMYKVGDQLLVSYGKDFDGSDAFYIMDYIRRDALLYLFAFFVVLTLLITKWQGLSSIFGMGISFLVIFYFILPKIASGANPILIAILGALLIIPVTFYLSHGLNKKTTVAIGGTLIALILTGFLAAFFIDAAKLTGFATEEAMYLQIAKDGILNVKGLILAGIIIGVLGVLDDITISQAAIVAELHKTDRNLGFVKLYTKAMNIGKDHISSLVNTLILVYAGAALPLLLLFLDGSKSFAEVINYELVAEEIVRTLVASIGLIIAVPITTFLAALTAKSGKSV